jgi:hypothetical protein
MAKSAIVKPSKKAAKKSATKLATKSATKSAAKAATKSATKPAKRSAKQPVQKSSKKKADLLKPTMIKTGKGATPAELGKAVVEHVNAMAAADTELWKRHFHPGFVSIEGSGEAWSGRKAVDAKCHAWMNAHTVHSCKASGPFVGATGFSVLYDMDVESKDGTMPRMKMQEVGVYTVKKGKVVQEEFMYGGM